MPNFFEYPKMIVNELNNLGYSVDFFDDRPSSKGVVKAILRINRNLISQFVQEYFKKIVSYISDKNYDVFLLISGQSLSFSEQMIKKIKDKQPKAICILYQWDSIKNFPYIERMYKYFDKCYSFDKDDVKNNKNLKFLPLFYSRKYEKIGQEKTIDFYYDCSYVGTAHPQKFRYINEISNKVCDLLPKQFIYHYMPSKLKFIYHKLTSPEYRGAKLRDFELAKISSDKMMDIIKHSKCVLDSPQGGQTGLTIRTFECLGAKRKLITTNEDVKNYDFYREANILIYDGIIDKDSPFFTQSYEEIPKEIYQKYSLRNWLKELLQI